MNYLARMAQRAIGQPLAVQPRLPSLFESPSPIEADDTRVSLRPPTQSGENRQPPAARIDKPDVATQARVPSVLAAEPRQAAPRDAAERESRSVEPTWLGAPAPRARAATAPTVEWPAASAAAVPAVQFPGEREQSPGPAAMRSAPQPPPTLTLGRVPLLQPPDPTETTIHVHIGRVDVRAIQSAPAAPPRARPPTSRPSLEEYLDDRGDRP